MTRKYCDYIKVDSDFIPVFSVHKDKDYPNKWKSFFPHESFKLILSQVVDTLEMGSVEKNKPLWMFGAYGTGKTFASFVIKHIFEDDLGSVKDYCETFNMMNLYARIKGIREKGKTLVVHRSYSSGIVGNNKLINCFIESIKKSLIDNDYKYFGEKSQYDKILSVLKDPNSSFDFKKAYQKHKEKFLEYASPESIIKQLENLGIEDSIDLLETIVQVAESENYMFAMTIEQLLNWIDDIVKVNKLHSIVFIWDEFTEFFKNNQNNITGLQEIAQASATIKFYLFLITHSNAQIINDKDAKKIIEARFKISMIEMADTTAFKLMGQAIKIKPDLLGQWEKIVDDLWNKVEKSIKNTILRNAIDIDEAELKNLLPLHPYSAYLLKFIAKDISSNQRTMFQFLCGDFSDGDEIKTNFVWFIENYSSELNCWQYLSLDYIWSYFFTNNNVDLDSSYKSIISLFNNYENIFSNDENKKRVLKVALLFTAIQQKTGATRSQGQSGLLRPTLTNIAASFVGTPIQSQISNIMEEFVQKGIFGKIQENNDTLFVPPAGNIDQEQFDMMKEELEKQITFEKIIEDYKIYENFLPNDYLKYRYAIYPITSNNFKSALEKAVDEKNSKIPAFYLFAKNESEQEKIKTIIDKVFCEINRNIVIVDFSSEIFSDSSYEKFIYSKTEERYYGSKPNHDNQHKLAKSTLSTIIYEWKQKLQVTSIDIYSKQKEKCDKIQGSGNLKKILEQINFDFFGCGLEHISMNDKLFAESGFKETVAQMAMNKITIPSNYNYLNLISSKLTEENIWKNIDYFKSNPNHTVSRMKIRINELINNKFENCSMVAISDIWEALEQPPFGLLSCTGSVFLLGFLLKEYADSKYYKYDKINTVNLSSTDLSELIYVVVKGLPKAKDQYIVKQTAEHAEFCRITANIFKISKSKQNSIDDIAKNINLFLKDNDYPLWALKFFVKEEMSENEDISEITNAIELYCEFVSPENMAGRDKTKIADDLYNLYKSNLGIDSILEEIIESQNMKLGMEYYIASYKPELIQIIKRLGISQQEMLIALNKKLSADSSYLWIIGDTNHQIDNIYLDYCLIESINKILPDSRKTMEEIKQAIVEKLNILKLPESIIRKDKNEIVSIIDCLNDIKNNNTNNIKAIIEIFDLHADEFNKYFNNQHEPYAKAIRNNLNTTISEDEVDYLFEKSEPNVYHISVDEFIFSIKKKLDNYRKNRKINQLCNKWKEKTKTDNPNEWSKKQQMPILCLFESDIIAQKVFDLINKTRNPQSEKEIDEAINFINSDKLDKLQKNDECNEIFRNYYCGEYSFIIKNVNELKEELVNSIGNDANSWFLKKSIIEDYIKKYATNIYKTMYISKVIEKIRILSPEKAQKYLKELVEDKPLIGISILKDDEEKKNDLL